MRLRVLLRSTRHSLQRSSATRSSSRRAAEAVAAGGNPVSLKPSEGIEIPNRQSLARFAHLNVEHLVEIAVVELSVPAHTDKGPAHKVCDSGRIEMVHQQTHVRLVFSALVEKGSKAPDGHVRQCEEPVELNSESLVEVFLVIRFQFLLRRGQRGAERVVDEIQYEVRSWSSIAKTIQKLERMDALLKDAAAALLIDVFRCVARKAGNDLHFMLCKEFG